MSNMINANYTSAVSSYAEKHSVGRVSRSEASFQTQIQRSASRKYSSATEDYKRRHPKEAGIVDDQVRAGKNVLKKNGVENVNRESMTMEEYKKFFTELMDSIPYSRSQIRDTHVWSITDKGWEQMKNDPDYEAWVLGYTAQDRAVNNPFASMPGYSPCYHTEHFGASIDEHLGQCIPMNNPAVKKSSDEDDESWWEKRTKRMKEIMKKQEKKAIQDAINERKIQQAEMLKEHLESNMRLHQFLIEQFAGDQRNSKSSTYTMANVGNIAQMYDNLSVMFSESLLSGK